MSQSRMSSSSALIALVLCFLLEAVTPRDIMAAISRKVERTKTMVCYVLGYYPKKKNAANRDVRPSASVSLF